jgi:hypothetical protein
MYTKFVKFVLLVALSLSATACSFGGHGVDVALPSNGCSVAACTNQPNSGGVSIH